MRTSHCSLWRQSTWTQSRSESSWLDRSRKRSIGTSRLVCTTPGSSRQQLPWRLSWTKTCIREEKLTSKKSAGGKSR
uniref:DEAD-box helicase 24 n=1 Tax=Molossus molossus TaxID=27622 RepID=A0A7J8JSC9_MOLMO|nr:DEAD-box helicase 24 [Molossus molossus]